MKNSVLGFGFNFRAFIQPALNQIVRPLLLGHHPHVRGVFPQGLHRALVFTPFPLLQGGGERGIHTGENSPPVIRSDLESDYYPTSPHPKATIFEKKVENIAEEDDDEPINLESGDVYVQAGADGNAGVAASDPQLVETTTVTAVTAYDVLDRPVHTEVEMQLISDEIDRRFLNIHNTILGRDDIESLEALARSLGLDIRQVMHDRFVGIYVPEEEQEDLYELIQDLRYLIQNYGQGTLVGDDYKDLARLLVLFGLDASLLEQVAISGSATQARIVSDTIGELIKDYHNKENSNAIGVSGEVYEPSEPTDLE